MDDHAVDEIAHRVLNRLAAAWNGADGHAFAEWVMTMSFPFEPQTDPVLGNVFTSSGPIAMCYATTDSPTGTTSSN